MAAPSLNDIDFLKLIEPDSDVGIAILSGSGEVISYSSSMPTIFARMRATIIAESSSMRSSTRHLRTNEDSGSRRF